MGSERRYDLLKIIYYIGTVMETAYDPKAHARTMKIDMFHIHDLTIFMGRGYLSLQVLTFLGNVICSPTDIHDQHTRAAKWGCKFAGLLSSKIVLQLRPPIFGSASY
jgi:hypothetical protein